MRFKNLPKLPRSLLRVPRGVKRVKVADLKKDLEALGEEIAEEFRDKIESNIRENKYGFTLSDATIRKKGHDIPLIDTGELIDAIYQEGTEVSVEDSQRNDSDLTNKQLAIVHEYGVKDKDIPARPVWRKTFEDFRPTAEKRVKTFLKQHKLKK